MADWRQIQARIRKAKTSSDPAAQLAELYQRTRDAMVAFELAQWHEKSGNASDTVQWYTTAAQRFRRAQWRTKAQEALTRLGAPVPEVLDETSEHVTEPRSAAAAVGKSSSASAPSHIPYDPTVEEEVERERSHGPDESAVTSEEREDQSPSTTNGSPSSTTATAADSAQSKRRRRGRRGGRNRRGRGPADRPASSAPVTAAPSRSQQTSRPERNVAAQTNSRTRYDKPAETAASQSEGSPAARGREEVYDSAQSTPADAWQPASSSHTRSGPSFATSRSRAGDPGLSSRIAQLESQLRRLLVCPMSSLDEAEQAPAGPGVLLLSDSDQVTHYYVEACQTLRIAVGNLVRGGRGSRGGAQLKPMLAEHLGINDSKVSKYMKDHCAVRWIQLDEGAPELAHFAISVLRPVVTE